MPYQKISSDQLSLRDQLAIDRTGLANERTFLAYLRTSLMLVVSAISLIKLFPDNRLAYWVGMTLIPILLDRTGRDEAVFLLVEVVGRCTPIMAVVAFQQHLR